MILLSIYAITCILVGGGMEYYLIPNFILCEVTLLFIGAVFLRRNLRIFVDVVEFLKAYCNLIILFYCFYLRNFKFYTNLFFLNAVDPGFGNYNFVFPLVKVGNFHIQNRRYTLLERLWMKYILIPRIVNAESDSLDVNGEYFPSQCDKCYLSLNEFPLSSIPKTVKTLELFTGMIETQLIPRVRNITFLDTLTINSHLQRWIEESNIKSKTIRINDYFAFNHNQDTCIISLENTGVENLSLISLNRKFSFDKIPPTLKTMWMCCDAFLSGQDEVLDLSSSNIKEITLYRKNQNVEVENITNAITFPLGIEKVTLGFLKMECTIGSFGVDDKEEDVLPLIIQFQPLIGKYREMKLCKEKRDSKILEFVSEKILLK